ncbi:MAG: LysM peptidoglycan-binding domain-containing protein [Carnobacterium sp.]|uniref:LysM peptidoglycan-binding domain-containing protein n=1 Tax=Carnobacterium sp. TaxID=48221 RepID=UPI003C748BBD
MTKVKDILVITGHGQGPVSYDPGAVGNGTSEAKFLREVFVPAMKKFAPSNMRFHTGRDVFAWRDAKTIVADEIIELHLDAGVAAAEDGHIIIYSDFNPDDLDKRTVGVIKDNVGIRYGGVSKRNNLYNLNKFAQRGISYRLAELAFITNKKEMDYMFANVDKYAKELVEAILNAKTTIKEPVKVENVYTVVKGETLWSIGRKFNVTVKDLKDWNSLKSDLIVIGQKLTLRGAKDLTPVTEKEPAKSPGAALNVDGYLGYNTTVELQKHFGTPVDGKLSSPSVVIKSVQKAVNTKVDGYIGPNTIKAMQRYFGTPIDGVISKPSVMVKAMQVNLNKGKF